MPKQTYKLRYKLGELRKLEADLGFTPSMDTLPELMAMDFDKLEAIIRIGLEWRKLTEDKLVEAVNDYGPADVYDALFDEVIGAKLGELLAAIAAKPAS